MSLIADALKAAQKEKARRAAPARTPQQSYFPFRFPARGSGDPMVSPLVIGFGVAAAAIALTTLVVVFSPSRKPAPRQVAAAVPFTDSVPVATEIVPIGGSSLAMVDSAADEPSERMDFEPPPPRSTGSQSARRPPARLIEPDPEIAAAPLPSIVSAAPPAGRSGSNRLEITVDRPVQSGEGGGLFEQGLAAQRQGDYQAAKNFYLQAINIAPPNADLWNNLGTAYRALRDLSGAEGAFRQATRIDNKFAPAWSNLGLVLAQQGRGREAVEALEEAVRLDPANTGAKVNLAIQQHAAGLLPDARRLLEDALRIDPRLAEAHYELGRVLEKQNDRTEAVRQYELFLSTANGRFPEQEQAVRIRLRSLSR